MVCACLIGGGLAGTAAAQNDRSGVTRDRGSRLPVITLSGSHRARLETLDPQFRPGLGPNDQALSLRTILKLDVAWPKWTFVGELMDSRIELNARDSLLNVGNINALEPTEIAATRTWNSLLGSASTAVVRFGRITADLGSRRLLGRHRYRNTTNSFVGVDWQWQGGNTQSVRALFLMPTPIRPRSREALFGNDARIDDVDRRQQLRVLQYARPLSARGDRFEAAWFGMIDTRRDAGRNLDTFSFRILRPASPGRWFYEAELIEQGGRSVDRDPQSTQLVRHSARSHHAEVGYAFDGQWSPAIALLADYASGDNDPGDGTNRRFDRLFGPVRPDFGPTGIYGPVVIRSNVDAIGMRVRARPFPDWRVTATLHRLQLAADRDAWVTTGLSDPSGQSGDSIGRQFELTLAWRPDDRRIQADVGLTRLATGSFVGSVAPQRAATSMYYYLSTTVAFGH